MRRHVLLALLLTVALVGAAAAAPPTVAELLGRVPASAQVVVAVDAAALREHPLVQQWLAERHAAWSGLDDETDSFLRDAGLVPERDVEATVAAVTPTDGRPSFVVQFAGYFDPAALGSALTARGAQALQLSGGTGYLLPTEGSGSRTVAVLGPDVIVLGDETSVRGLQIFATGSPLIAEEVAARRIDPAAHFFFVADLPPRERAASGGGTGGDPSLEQVVEASGAVRRVGLQGNLGEALALRGFATADSTENAELLRDAVKGAIAAMRLKAQEKAPELVDVLRGVDVRIEGARVLGAVAIPVELIEKLLREHAHGEAPAPVI
jgi:hypothetical protein